MSYKLKQSNSGGWQWVAMIVVAATLLITILTVLIIRRAYEQNLQPVSASQRAVTFTVPKGASAKEIAQSLEEADLIRAAWAFEWYIRNNNLKGDLLAGTYSLRPNQNVQDIVSALTQGKIATDLVTILPGQRLDQIRSALISYGFDESEVDNALNANIYIDHPALIDKPEGASLEGYLYPESFHKTADTRPSDIVRASLDEMQKQLTPEIRSGIARQGLTVHQGIILASIVGQEVNNKDDQPVVAQVFLKRLREGRPLESDITVFYGAIINGQEPKISYDSDYNTYKHKGLTPGPVSNVNKQTLEAVVNPANTDYLYFVAGDDGKTYFSKTLAEHQKLTADHCKKLCNSGE